MNYDASFCELRKIRNYNSPQITSFKCIMCNEEKTEDWCKKEYPFKICNECKNEIP